MEPAKKILDLCCGLAKADRGDPQIDAMAALLRPLLSVHWRRQVALAVEEARQRIQQLADEPGSEEVAAVAAAGDRRDRALEDLVLAILASIGVILQQPPGAASAIRQAAERVLERGAEAAGVPLVSTFRGVDLRAAAADDAFLILRLRADSALEEARPLVRAALTRAALRRAAPGAAATAPAATGGAGIISVEGWVAALERALEGNPALWLDPALDLWAYRWANVSSFLSARAEGFQAFIALNNPPEGPDSRTTPFCVWVHGRLVPIGQMERSVTGYLSALRAGDRLLVERAWPLLPSSIADKGTTEQFERAFADVGLAPYHFRCRTRNFPVRLG